MRPLVDAKDPGLTSAQRELAQTICSGPRGAILGPMRALLHAPELGDLLQRTGAQLRFEGRLPGDLRELAILITAIHWQAGFEWQHHRPIGEREGLAPALLDALAQGETPEFNDDRQRLVYDCAIALLRDHQLPDSLFDAANEAFGPAGIIELMTILGYYGLLAMVINGFEITE